MPACQARERAGCLKARKHGSSAALSGLQSWPVPQNMGISTLPPRQR